MEEILKTAHELLIEGFKGNTDVLKNLSLGETKIKLNRIQQTNLKKAIESKDYYAIKSIVGKLHSNPGQRL